LKKFRKELKKFEKSVVTSAIHRAPTSKNGGFGKKTAISEKGLALGIAACYYARFGFYWRYISEN
jgi:hypothetical protein